MTSGHGSTDVVVVGGGAAGLMAAATVVDRDPALCVAVFVHPRGSVGIPTGRERCPVAALNARYGLLMDFDSIPGLAERDGLVAEARPEVASY